MKKIKNQRKQELKNKKRMNQIKIKNENITSIKENTSKIDEIEEIAKEDIPMKERISLFLQQGTVSVSISITLLFWILYMNCPLNIFRNSTE